MWKVGPVQSMSESTGSSWGFTITTEHGKPLVAFSYETHGEATVAARHVEAAVERAVAVYPILRKCKNLHSTMRTVSDWHAHPIARSLLGTRIRPQAPRLRRAASRLWGLTAQRVRANQLPLRRSGFPMPLEMRADICRTMSDRSGTGFLR